MVDFSLMRTRCTQYSLQLWIGHIIENNQINSPNFLEANAHNCGWCISEIIFYKLRHTESWRQKKIRPWFKPPPGISSNGASVRVSGSLPNALSGSTYTVHTLSSGPFAWNALCAFSHSQRQSGQEEQYSSFIYMPVLPWSLRFNSRMSFARFNVALSKSFYCLFFGMQNKCLLHSANDCDI